MKPRVDLDTSIRSTSKAGPMEANVWMRAVFAAGAVPEVFSSSGGVFRISLRIPERPDVFSFSSDVEGVDCVSAAASLKSLRFFVTRKVPESTTHIGLWEYSPL